MGQVGHGGAGHGDPGQSADLDALVVLDLGDGGPYDVHELDGLAPLPGGRGPGEDDQALGVAAHARGEVVEAEQVGEFVGVLGPALHCVEQGELLVQQDLAAAGEVDEHLGDPGAQFGLLDGALDGGALKGVEGLSDLADLVLLVLQARRLGLDVDLFARREPAQDAGQPHARGLVGLLAQPAQVADEAAAHADGEHEGEQQGDQPEDAHDGGLGDGAHRGRVDPVLVAVGRRVVERGEPVEHTAAEGVPALGGDAGGHLLGVGVEDELLGLAQRGGRGALPEAVVALAFLGRQLVHADLVDGPAPGDQLGDVPQFGAGDAAGDEGGAEQGVLAGEQLPGAGGVDEGAVLLVEFRGVDDVEGGEHGVAGVDHAVVEVEGLRPGEAGAVDALAQRTDALEAVEHGGEAGGVVRVERVAHLGGGDVAAQGGEGVVGGDPGAPQRAQRVGGARVGEVEEGLPSLLLQGADGVLGGIGDLLHDGGDVEELDHLAAHEERGVAPDRGQGQQWHQEQRHDLPADGLPAKAHGLPQPAPLGSGAHMCVNKRREPTTAEGGTRRSTGVGEVRKGNAAGGVVHR
ncbi:hypothetical protein B0E37_06230 [Streptomyces sp. MH192]|nr:hypothetical protein [Streptomyces sp. MH192]MCF0103630.1 hypothetical protein [Streptomyces sp. MH191]